MELERQFEEMLTRIIERALEGTVGKYVENAVGKALQKGEFTHNNVDEDDQNQDYYTRKDIENKLNVTTTTIVRWEKEGRIKSEKVRGRRVYDRSQIDHLIKSGILIKYGLKCEKSMPLYFK